MKRFYCDTSLSDRGVGDQLRLSADESHHLSRVMRLDRGDAIEVFDGRGACAAAVVGALERGEVLVRLSELPRTSSASHPRLILAVAPPKSDRFRMLVEKCVELGVDQLIPLVTERSVVEPGGNKLDRLREAVIAACKQCGRNRLLELSPVMPWSRLLEEMERFRTSQAAVLVADRGGDPVLDLPVLRGTARPSSVLAVVGPEGGLTREESGEAEARAARRVRLAGHILRTETAAIAAAALLRSALDTAACDG